MGGGAVGSRLAAYQPTNNLGCQLEGQPEISIVGGVVQNFPV